MVAQSEKGMLVQIVKLRKGGNGGTISLFPTRPVSLSGIKGHVVTKARGRLEQRLF